MIRLDDALIQRFLAYSTAKGNTVKWVRTQQRHLRALASQLRGRDLRRLPLRVLRPLVEGRPHAIATIKALYGYLRQKTDELEPADDPTLHRLIVPQRRPTGVDKALKAGQVRQALKRLREPWRSRLALQAATGIHTTELQRFAKSGKVVSYRGQPGAVVFIELPHKSSAVHRVALGRGPAQAARKVLAAGPFTAEFYHLRVKEAADFTPGRLRHTVATLCVNKGHDMAAVATFLGHKTPQTTRRWYAKFAVPRNPLLGTRGSRGRRAG